MTGTDVASTIVNTVVLLLQSTTSSDMYVYYAVSNHWLRAVPVYTEIQRRQCKRTELEQKNYRENSGEEW